LKGTSVDYSATSTLNATLSPLRRRP
jgi:hypothetical protein